MNKLWALVVVIAMFSCVNVLYANMAFTVYGKASLRLNKGEVLRIRDEYEFNISRDNEKWIIALHSLSGDELWDETVGTKDGVLLCRLVKQWKTWEDKKSGAAPTETGFVENGPFPKSAQIIVKCLFAQWILSPGSSGHETGCVPLTDVFGVPVQALRMETHVGTVTTEFYDAIQAFAPCITNYNGRIFPLPKTYAAGYLAWSIHTLDSILVDGVRIPKRCRYEKSVPKVAPRSRDDVRVIYQADMEVTNITHSPQQADWLPVIAGVSVLMDDRRWESNLVLTNSLGRSQIAVTYIVTNQQWRVEPGRDIQDRVASLVRDAEMLRKKQHPLPLVMKAFMLALFLAPVMFALIRLGKKCI
jgi:hypothetical protein